MVFVTLVYFVNVCFLVFIIPLIIGSVLLFLYYKDLKKKKELLSETGFGDVRLTQRKLDDLQVEIEKLSKEKEKLSKDLNGIHDFKTALDQKNIVEDKIKSLNNDIEKKNELIRKLEQKIKELDQSIIKLEDEELLQSFGIYTPKYDLTNSQQYKERLKEIRDKQKEMVRKKEATNHYDNWQLDGSTQKGKVLNNNNIKLTIRAFNNECDAIVSSVTFNNITSMERRIKKAYDTLNKVNKHSKIEIKKEYLALKLDELFLAYEYKQKLEEGKEEQRRIKEQIREEQKVLQEMKKAREKVEKEEKHFSQALDDLYSKIMASSNDEERNILEEKIKELEQQLEEVKKIKVDIENREQNTRAGYVYIISNIGSFGENIYKIGMTRRLEPIDRVKELSSASVPFGFDVHAMIFSDDAPTLENSLHKAFHHKRINLVNSRKEFFKVSLEEIEEVVKNNHNKTVEFTKLAEAKEFRESIELTKEEFEAKKKQLLGI